MSYIIKSPDELKDPFLCYCIFKRYMDEAEEDYMDYNESIVNLYPLIFWLKGRCDISEHQVEKLLNIEYLGLQDVFGEIMFPNTYGHSVLSEIKKYTLLAEYMCQISDFRQRVWDSLYNTDSFEDGKFYTNDDGISLACIIEDTDMKSKNINYKKALMMKKSDLWELSYKDQFDLGLEMNIEESDIKIER